MEILKFVPDGVMVTFEVTVISIVLSFFCWTINRAWEDIKKTGPLTLWPQLMWR